ncbi:histidine kinase/DNA gyrase B/HSP90-like ATPase [Rhizobium subbaraonis]|uniref:histidine kinase n=1 Tax=Rhizobium subbaraonis TaxID=908946 RepID=A0A285V4Y3_9HYPH|nr:ATP-binding protein [Rhizobium subbaraonis]SOC48066.1 histidine kinase/DNA gyrase B/HSP90-like ATPase [Rhizobium subbaraonis]
MESDGFGEGDLERFVCLIDGMNLIVHDFNNLLAVIGGNLEMLESRLLASEDLGLVREARSAAEDGVRLTSQLLAFGRRPVLAPRAVDVGKLVAEFSGILQRRVGDAVELRIVVTGRRLRAVVDKAQLQTVLLNLATNARDAMPNGGRLTVELSGLEVADDYSDIYPRLQPGRYIVISLTDNGVGMPANVRERAFEPFFTTKPSSAGEGLGLSMVYGFARQSAGHVRLDSAPEQGTTVRLFLPRARDEAVAVPIGGAG